MAGRLVLSLSEDDLSDSQLFVQKLRLLNVVRHPRSGEEYVDDAQDYAVNNDSI